MIWDIDSASWRKRTIPYKDGLPVRRYFNHYAKDWFLVVDPFSPLKVYWADMSTTEWRMSPPPLDKDTGTQTCADLNETGCQTESAEQNDAECQTIGLFGSDLPADADVWSTLGSSVAGLPLDRQTAIYNRLVRFLDLGLLDLRNQSS